MINKIFILLFSFTIFILEARQSVEQAREAAAKRAASRQQAYQQNVATIEKKHPSKVPTPAPAPSEEPTETGMFDLSAPTTPEEQEQETEVPLTPLKTAPTMTEDKTQAAFDQVINQFTYSNDNPSGILDADSNYEVMWTTDTEKQVLDSVKDLIKQLNQKVTELIKNSATKKYIESGDFSSQNNSRALRKTVDKISQFLDNRTQFYKDQKRLTRAQKQKQKTITDLQDSIKNLGEALKYTSNQ